MSWSREDRLQLMRDVIRMIAAKTTLDLKNAPAFAKTYGVKECEVTAEMMKYPREDCAK